jgi:alpha-D-xyloside xylohydrolase
MLGERLLVAPVFSDSGDVSYYVPAGKWTNLLSGAVVEGPGWKNEYHAYSSLPLLVRPNSVIAMGDCEARADYDFPSEVTLRAYQIQDGARVTVAVPSQTGEPCSRFELRRDGRRVIVTPDGVPSAWRLLMVGEAVESATGATIETNHEGSLVVPASPGSAVTVTLRAVS